MTIPLPPCELDVQVARALSALLPLSPRFDAAVQSGIHHNVFGGMWFAGAAFLSLWLAPTRRQASRHVLLCFVSTSVALPLALVASLLFFRTAPNQTAALREIYEKYGVDNTSTNCFPSGSTAIYGAVAFAQLRSSGHWGTLLFSLLIVFVALPRMFVGGHYLTDVIAGLAIAVVAALVSFRLCDTWGEQFLAVLDSHRSFSIAAAIVMFLWLWQIAVEFRELDWLQRVVHSLFSVIS